MQIYFNSLKKMAKSSNIRIKSLNCRQPGALCAREYFQKIRGVHSSTKSSRPLLALVETIFRDIAPESAAGAGAKPRNAMKR